MNGPRPCRLLIDPPAAGPWNMAVDETLLEWSAEEGAACWRFYRWQEPTVSLGYFQTHDDRRQHSPSRHCPAVRRLTGGGAIVHDAELTYSLVLPADHPLAVRRDLLYRAVHTALIRVLADLGLEVTLCDGAASGEAGRQPWLCFLRRSSGDVLLGPAKIAGSAQRRRRSAVLQHGSLLLRRSASAPELPGLEDLAGRSIADAPLIEAWLGELADCLGVVWQPGSLDAPQRQRAATVAARYVSADWTEHRRAGGA